MILKMTNGALQSWVTSANAADCDFPIQNLPFGIFSVGQSPSRCGVAIGNMIVDLHACEERGLLDASGTFARHQLNDFIALGSHKWAEIRAQLTALLTDGADENLPLVAMADAVLHLPVQVTEFTDFYASKNHAFNVGTLFRGPENALPPQWTHMPIGYNGRASSVVVSGTALRRPMGQVRAENGPEWTACRRLDLELEMGAIVGTSTVMGTRVNTDQAEEMIFGYVLLNDWSARDIQAWEYQPLGPCRTSTTLSARDNHLGRISGR
jgi:fumarylacetoacetase